MTNNKTVIKWLDEMKELLTPDEVVWVDGTDAQTEQLRKIAVELGELEALNQDLLPIYNCPGNLDSYSYLKKLCIEGLKNIFESESFSSPPLWS